MDHGRFVKISLVVAMLGMIMLSGCIDRADQFSVPPVAIAGEKFNITIVASAGENTNGGYPAYVYIQVPMGWDVEFAGGYYVEPTDNTGLKNANIKTLSLSRSPSDDNAITPEEGYWAPCFTSTGTLQYGGVVVATFSITPRGDDGTYYIKWALSNYNGGYVPHYLNPSIGFSQIPINDTMFCRPVYVLRSGHNVFTFNNGTVAEVYHLSPTPSYIHIDVPAHSIIKDFHFIMAPMSGNPGNITVEIGSYSTSLSGPLPEKWKVTGLTAGIQDYVDSHSSTGDYVHVPVKMYALTPGDVIVYGITVNYTGAIRVIPSPPQEVITGGHATIFATLEYQDGTPLTPAEVGQGYVSVSVFASDGTALVDNATMAWNSGATRWEYTLTPDIYTPSGTMVVRINARDDNGLWGLNNTLVNHTKYIDSKITITGNVLHEAGNIIISPTGELIFQGGGIDFTGYGHMVIYGNLTLENSHISGIDVLPWIEIKGGNLTLGTSAVSHLGNLTADNSSVEITISEVEVINGMVFQNGTVANISYSMLSLYQPYGGLYTDHSEINIDNTTVVYLDDAGDIAEQTLGVIIMADASNITLADVTINGVAYYSINAINSNLTYNRGEIYHPRTYGEQGNGIVFSGQYSYLNISHVTFSELSVAISTEAMKSGHLDNLTIENSTYGIKIQNSAPTITIVDSNIETSYGVFWNAPSASFVMKRNFIRTTNKGFWTDWSASSGRIEENYIISPSAFVINSGASVQITRNIFMGNVEDNAGVIFDYNFYSHYRGTGSLAPYDVIWGVQMYMGLSAYHIPGLSGTTDAHPLTAYIASGATFSSLQEAINLSSNNDVIHLPDMLIYDHGIINDTWGGHNLSIVGDNTRIYYGSSTPVFTVTAGIKVQSVNISGVVFIYDGIEFSGNFHDSTIKDVVLRPEKSQNYVIKLEDSSGLRFENITEDMAPYGYKYSYPLYLSGYVNNTTFEGFSILGNGQWQGGYVVYSRADVNNITIKDVYTQPKIYSVFRLLYPHTAQNITVQNITSISYVSSIIETDGTIKNISVYDVHLWTAGDIMESPTLYDAILEDIVIEEYANYIFTVYNGGNNITLRNISVNSSKYGISMTDVITMAMVDVDIGFYDGWNPLQIEFHFDAIGPGIINYTIENSHIDGRPVMLWYNMDNTTIDTSGMSPGEVILINISHAEFRGWTVNYSTGMYVVESNNIVFQDLSTEYTGHNDTPIDSTIIIKIRNSEGISFINSILNDTKVDIDNSDNITFRDLYLANSVLYASSGMNLTIDDIEGSGTSILINYFTEVCIYNTSLRIDPVFIHSLQIPFQVDHCVNVSMSDVSINSGNISLPAIYILVSENVNLTRLYVEGPYGVYLASGSAINLTNSTIRNGIYNRSNVFGLYVNGYIKDHVTIENCTIGGFNNGNGIYIDGFHTDRYLTIRRNGIMNNSNGIYMTSSTGSDVMIYMNVFNNTINAHLASTTILSSGTRGNYWSNYTGTDANGDGIGDVPYITDGGAVDHYPLVYPTMADDYSPVIVPYVPARVGYLSTAVLKFHVFDPSGIGNISLIYTSLWGYNFTLHPVFDNGTHAFYIPPQKGVGEINYTLHVMDIFGNSAWFNGTLEIVDDIAPEIENITHPDVIDGSRDIEITVVYVEDFSLSAWLNWTLGNTSGGFKLNPVVIGNNRTIFHGTIDALCTTGILNITITAMDENGNVDIDEFSITLVDVLPPDITVEYPHYVGIGDNISVNITIHDASDVEAWLQYNSSSGVVNTTLNLSNGMASVTIPGLNTTGNVSFAVSAIDSLGKINSTGWINVPVNDDIPPVAIAGEDMTVYPGDPVVLNASLSSDNIGIVNFTWSITGNNLSIVLYGMVVITQLPEGVYTVTLTVRDMAGNFATDTITINSTYSADVLAPVASAVAITPSETGTTVTVGPGTTVTFDASGSHDDHEIVDYTWSFDDNGTRVLHGERVSYIFNNPGEYIVILRVTDRAGNYNTTTLVVNVVAGHDAIPPVAVAGENMTVYAGQKVVLNASRSSDNVGIVNYTWIISGNGMNITLYGMVVEYVFTTPGTYEVKLIVRDAAGHEASDIIVITVLPSISISIGPLRFQDGSPVVGAHITISGQEYITDASGYIHIESITPGTYNVTIVYGTLQYTTTLVVHPNGSYSIDLPVLPMEMTVSIGPVLDEDGNPVVGAEVTVEYNGTTYTATTDENGYAEITLPADATGKPLTVHVTAPGYGSMEFTLTVGEDGTINANIPKMEKKPQSEEQSGDMTPVIAAVVLAILAMAGIAILIIRRRGTTPSVEEITPVVASPDMPPLETPPDMECECPNCGTPVSCEAEVCPECGEAFVMDEFRCPTCGAIVSADDTVCPECGEVFGIPESGIDSMEEEIEDWDETEAIDETAEEEDEEEEVEEEETDEDMVDENEEDMLDEDTLEEEDVSEMWE